jgi:hypothetical protein
MAYLDNTGLYRKYGTEKTTGTIGGEYRTAGLLREIEFTVTLSTLTETETPLSDVVFFPKMRVQEVEVITTTAAATGTAIDVGLIRTDRTTEIDYDGFLAAFPTAAMDLAGERTIFTAASTVPASATGTGALIGATTTNVGYVTASRTTATAFTAGVVRIKVRYYAV